jgi:hypothetical protein
MRKRLRNNLCIVSVLTKARNNKPIWRVMSLALDLAEGYIAGFILPVENWKGLN